MAGGTQFSGVSGPTSALRSQLTTCVQPCPPAPILPMVYVSLGG